MIDPTEMSANQMRALALAAAPLLVALLAATPALAGSETLAANQIFNAAPVGSADFVEQPIGASAAPTPAAAPAATAPAGAGPLGFLATAGHSSNLLGDMWGLRTALSKFGVSLAITETSEALGNVTGGARQGFEYDGLTTATLQLDTQRAFALEGGLFNISALQVHGDNLSADNLYTLQTASGIEADRATRFWEIWYQQKFGDNLDVKVGQQSLDQEFMNSQNAGYFVNTMFGWPMLPSADLPGGGPAYPLSALGARVRARVNDNIVVLAGLFNGSPVADDTGDPQLRDPHGLSFPLNGGVLAIAELQFQYPGSGSIVQAGEPEPLGRTYKLGVWYDSESFADLRYNTFGQPLGNPANNQTPAARRGDYAIYAVADQMIWRDAEADRNINVFLRPMFTPLQDRNLIRFSLNAGLVMHEPFHGRDDDTAGVGLGVARVSNGASGLDADTALYDPTDYTPVRGTETFLEATYQYQVMPWWQIQPDVQYVFNPGAGIADPGNPSQRVRDELVFGIRTNVTF